MPKVSVIVPVYNPGSNIDDLLRTVLDQSLPSSDYEVIFVDDGSTDDTPARLDSLAEEHDHVRVTHIPNSGWPGLPRNMGTDMARGTYVFYMDNDDYLGHEALERLVAKADEDQADVVVGKVVGHGKFVPRALFRRNRSNVTLEWEPLVGLLTAHRLFRRSFLVEQDIRFPEGKRRLEDHMFVMKALFRARSISILADYPCYHWMRRDESESFRPFEPGPYFANVREVLDLLAENTEPGPFRVRLETHWYRSKLLHRVGGPAFTRRDERDPGYNRELFDEIHPLANERFGPEHEALLPFHLKLRSQLLRSGDFAALKQLSAWEHELRTTADAYVREVDGRIELRVEARLDGEQPLRFRRDGERILWVPPAGLAERVNGLDLDVSGKNSVANSWVQLLLRNEADGSEFMLTGAHELRLSTEGTVVLTSQASIDPATAAGGGPLAAGEWGLEVNAFVAGWRRQATARRRPNRSKRPMRLTVGADGTIADTTPAAPAPPSPPTGTVLLKRRVKRLLRR